MGFVRLKGFVLQSIPYRDSNLLLKILTADQGLITCSAPGAKRRNAPLKMVTSPFVFAEFDLFYNRNRYKLQGGNLIDGYLPLMEDVTRLTCLAHLAELVLDVLNQEAKADRAYLFWAYASYQITKDPDPFLIVHLAQLKFLADQGFAPWLDNCLICHDPFSGAGGRFYFSQGGAVCPKPACRHGLGDSQVMDLSLTSLHLLSYLLHLSHEKCFNIRVPDENRQEVINFSARYLSFVMEKDYGKLKLLKSLEKYAKGIL